MNSKTKQKCLKVANDTENFRDQILNLQFLIDLIYKKELGDQKNLRDLSDVRCFTFRQIES